MDPRVSRCLRHGLLASTALAGFGALLAPGPAAAGQLPTGYATAYGSVGFQRSSGTLNINQGSQAAIVNYNSFSIGRRNAVHIHQPNASSVLLNRVTGSTSTVIAGRLSANGQVYLINPNGIAITKSGVVKVGGGFVASSLGMTDDEFKTARQHFAGNGGRVSNRGTITIGRGGYADLIGGKVMNGGTIAVPMGSVGLGSGQMATLDVSGDGFLQVALPSTVNAKGALITDTGRISGVTVMVDAATARAAARNAVNIAGSIDSHTISGRSGAIQIGGGDGGAVAVSGRLSVASRRGTGGSVTITGAQIALTHARVNARGAHGGGTVRIGGDLHGGGALPHATNVMVDARSTINADATQRGNGGSVVVWSDASTSFAGTISAKGGPLGGNGGLVEVSSAGTLSYTGTAVLTAPHGAMGTLLLDPYDVTISSGTDANYTPTTSNGTTADTPTGTSVINAGTLDAQLATANVTITTGAAGSAGSNAGNITVAAPVTWSSGSLLTLTAANAIAIDAPITITGAGKLALNAATTTTNVASAQPLLSFGNGASVSYAVGSGSGIAGQSLTINNAPYALVYSMAQLAGISSGKDALATSLTAPTTPYPGPVVATLSGTLEGLGNTISGLKIDAPSAFDTVGLIGTLNGGGTVRDVGLVGGAVSATGQSSIVGSLVGFNGGTIAQAYTTAAVSGSETGAQVGGLVGQNYGSITQSYATGAISGSNSNETYAVGGLVGDNLGTITEAYATGTVSGGVNVGGLVGDNEGSITQAYATGAVSGFSNVGGLVGYNDSTIASAYFDTTTSGLMSTQGVGGGNTSGVTGETTQQLAQALPAGFVSTAWANVRNQTTPYLIAVPGPVYAGADTTPILYNLVFTPAQLQAIGSNLTGNYALAQNIDATGVAGFTPIGESTAYTGTFNGLGNTISNLTINTGATYAGLFGQVGSSGTVKNVGLVGGSVTDKGGINVGGLVGYNNGGTITQVYATGAVSDGERVGGLVGGNGGTITQAYATGAVEGGSSSVAGGLVGNNIGGTITQAYATGAVSGSSSDVGGLVGYNGGTITQAYATGAVSGSGTDAFVGGLVGYNGGTITQAYATGAVSGGDGSSTGGLVGVSYATITASTFDTQTAGQSAGVGGTGASQTGVTALTTAQLQSTATTNPFLVSGSSSPTGFAGGAAGTQNGVYPYLTSFFPNGVQAVSGFAYEDAGVTPAASGLSGAVTVSLDADGGRVAQATTGANGYYYVFLPAGTAAAGSSLLVSTAANATTGATNSATLSAFAASSGNTSGVNLYGNAVTVPTAATLLSRAPGLAAAQASATAAAGTDTNAAAAVAAITGHGFVATGASFTIDTPVTTPTTLVVQTAAGAPLTVAQPVTIHSGGSLGLLSGGALAIDANVTAQGAATVALGAATSTVPGTTTSVLDLSFAQGDAITFTNADGSPATGPVAGQALSINGTPYTLLYTLAESGSTKPDNGSNDVAGIDNNTAAGSDAGHYALATNLDGTGTTFTAALVGSGSNNFVGTLEGLGHTLANLTIDAPNTSDLGLIGSNGGTVRDIGVVGGSVSGSLIVGGLVGLTAGGTITQAYATGAVSGSAFVGGLVGQNLQSTITQAYATGAVSGGSRSQYVGGLVGANDGNITQAYATGAVSGGAGVGGLVGENFGPITQAYATGAVSGSSLVGGLVGFNEQGGTITQSTFDTQTTGQSAGIGLDTNNQTVTGLTTEKLQSTGTANPFGANSTFAGGAAGGENGVYPYLTSFFPNGVQAVSGIAYADRGVTPLASGANGAEYVTVDIAGTQTRAATGANGYYYVFGPTGLLQPTGTPTLAYTTADNTAGGTVTGAALITATGTTAHLDVWANTLIAPTTATTLSGAPTTGAALYGSNGNATLAATAIGGTGTGSIGNLAYAGYIATGGSFTVDSAVATGAASGGLYAQTTTGPITVTAAQTFTTPTGLSLYAGGALTFAAPVAESGAGPVNLAYDTNTTTPSVTDLSFAPGASLSFTGTNASTGAPLGTLTINGVGYTLLNALANSGSTGPDNGSNDVAGIDANAAAGGDNGNYALAKSLDGMGTTFTAALVGSGNNSFTGTLEGLGHTITNLTINGDDVGLIGTLAGTVRDLGLVGDSITGDEYVGGLVSDNSNGTITQSYATGSVTGVDYVGGLVGYNGNSGTITHAYATGNVTGNSDGIGGLVGYNAGTVTQAYATGNVTGSDYVGGLVGSNGGPITQAYATGSVAGSKYVGGLAGDNSSPITQAYATGSVAGSDYVGGLVGSSSYSTITQAYATGAVSGSSNVGGLVGLNDNGGTITYSTYDTQTTGQIAGIGVDNNNQAVTGLTTAQLQGTATSTFSFGSSPTGFAGGVAGGENNVYPYLTSFFPNGVQAVSGFAYKDGAGDLLTSPASDTMVATTRPGLVSVVAGGQVLGTATTGANGYYYVFSALGSVAPGAGVVAYTVADTAAAASGGGLAGSGAQDAASFTQSPGTASNTALNVYGTWRLDQPGTLTSVSTLDAAYAAAIGATAPSGFDLPNREIDAPGAFAVDSAVVVSGTLAVTSPGAVTQTASGPILAGSLLLGGTGTYALGAGANYVGVIAGNAGAVAFNDASDLQTGFVTDAAGAATTGLTTTGGLTLVSGGAITITDGAPVSGASPVLAATGAFDNAFGAGAVTASDGGRWLVYSSTPGADTFGGLDSADTAIFDATYATLPPGSVTQAGNRYLFANQPVLTVTTTSDSKVYGTDASAKVASDYTITGFDPGVAGAYLGDTAATATTGAPMVTSAGAPATANVGRYAIDATQGSLASPSGYAFAFADNGTLTVTPATITVSGATGVDKTYDGTAALPAGASGFTYGGVVNGDMVTVTAASAAYASPNAGPEAVDVSGLMLGGSGASNYMLSATSVTGSGVIGRAAVTVAGATGIDKTYDGTTALPAGATGFTYSGVVNGDMVTVTAASAAYASPNAGPEAVDVSGLMLSGAGASNYVLSATSVTGSGVIGRATITVAGATGIDKTYDAKTALPNGATGFTYTGVVGNSVTVTASRAMYDSPNAGQQTIDVAGLTISGAPAGDYVLSATSVTGSGTIFPAGVTVVANGGRSIYGNAPQDPGLSASGLRGGQGIGVLSGLSSNFALTDRSHAGSYTLTVQGMLTNANYQVVATDDGTFVVDQRALTIVADNESRLAGQANPPLTYAVGGMGLVNGDMLTGVLTTNATLASPRGTYPIDQGTLAASSDYAVTYVPGTLTIGAAPVVPAPVLPDISAADLASTADRAYLQVVGPPVDGLPFVFSTAAGEDPIGAQIVQGLTDPRFDQVIVCVKDICTLAAPKPKKPLRTSALETPR